MYFCQVTCQTPHPSTATTHSKSVWTASLFFSVLVVPCYALLLLGASIQPWQPGPQNNNANVFSLLVSCASTLTNMMANSILPVCLSKSDQAKVFNSVISQLSGQHYLQFHPGCHLQDCTVSYSVTRELSSVTDQASGTPWNPVIGSVKDIGEKSKAILNIALEREVLHLRFEAESQHPQLIQWVIISSLDWVHTRYFWTARWIVLTDASHGTQRFGQRLFCT